METDLHVRRISTLREETPAEVDKRLGEYRSLWTNRLDALHTEITRGQPAQGKKVEE